VIKKIFGFYKLPLYIITNPVDGFYSMKFENKGTVKMALFNFFLLCVVFAFNTQHTSIIVIPRNPLSGHAIYESFIFLVALLLFCIANWSVTSLTNGEGRFKDIIMAVCYSFTPVIITTFIATIISNFLSQEETGFYFMLLSVGIFYFVLLVFLGLLTVHNYTVFRAILTIFLTFISILIIVFLVTLLFTLLQQLQHFAVSVWTELIFRT